MKTVQEYIDERPQWADGTELAINPLTRMQWFTFALATAGKLFEGMVVFMTGVALPLIVKQWSLSAAEKGFVAAASLFGILIGATALGGLADRLGRKTMFIVEMALFTIFLFCLTLSPNVVFLTLFLFLVGTALGCDYPTAHLVISESIPSAMRGRLVLGAFGFQAVGALLGTAVGYLILANNPELGAWRWMYAVAIIPAALVTAARFYVVQSPHWLASKGQFQKAEEALGNLLKREPQYPQEIRIPRERKQQSREKVGVTSLFRGKKTRRATVFAAVPWFLQDLGTYGIGIFTPTILAATIGQTTEHPRNVAALVHNDILAAKGAALIDVLLIFGILTAIFLADWVGRVRLQIVGFLGCAAGLALAAASTFATGGLSIALVFLGFMMFSFMTNMGPNAMTYLLAGEVFPTRIRGLGAGLAASFAKIGAVTTAFLFPILLQDLGTTLLLSILVGTSLLGAFITWRFQIETTGVSLEKLHDER